MNAISAAAGRRGSRRYASLVAQGQIRPTATTTGDLDRLPAREPRGDESPPAVLIVDRQDEPR